MNEASIETTTYYGIASNDTVTDSVVFGETSSVSGANAETTTDGNASNENLDENLGKKDSYPTGDNNPDNEFNSYQDLGETMDKKGEIDSGEGERQEEVNDNNVYDDDFDDYFNTEESDDLLTTIKSIILPSASTTQPSIIKGSTSRTIISTPQDFNLEKSTTKPPTKSNKLRETIVETLAKLFFKTLDLSIKIKTALDDGNDTTQKVINIVSKKDDIPYPNNNNNNQLIKDLPDFIKITPDDAIVVNQDSNLIQEAEKEAFNEDSDENNVVDSVKPIVILIENSANILVNTTDGEIVTVDFSDLPTNDPVMREIIIR